jgi:hypothetical protein
MRAKLIVCVSVSVVMVALAQGQGTFQNLDFEGVRANLPSDGFGGYLAASNALPGWDAYAGTNRLSFIAYDDTGWPKVGLYDTNSLEYIIQGKFSVSLFGGAISQSGSVPTNALSLLVSAYYTAGAQPLGVTLAGQSLMLVPLSTNPHYTVYGADIAALAGLSGNLVFAGTGYMLDDIRFSESPIPEPSLPTLLALGACLVVMRRVRRGAGRGDHPRH